jgi:hypothetical protein
MTRLANRKRRLRAETLGAVFSQGRNREVCAELHPTHMDLWLKGTRTKYQLTYSAAFQGACNAAMLSARREKAKARKAGGK